MLTSRGLVVLVTLALGHAIYDPDATTPPPGMMGVKNARALLRGVPVPAGPAPCQEGQLRCSDGTCYDPEERCNGRNHCSDGSDELDCPTAKPEDCYDRFWSCFGNNPADPDFGLRSEGPLSYVDNQDGVTFSGHIKDLEYLAVVTGVPVTFMLLKAEGDQYTFSVLSSITHTANQTGLNSVPWDKEVPHNTRIAFEVYGGYQVPIPYMEETERTYTSQVNFVMRDDGKVVFPTENVQRRYQFRVCMEVRREKTYCATATPSPPSTTTEPVTVGQCEEGQLRCSYGACYDPEERCNGVNHCFDGSDEWECPTAAPTTTDPPITVGQCNAGQLRCSYGACYNPEERCNGRSHCSDGSDEWDCPTTVEPSFIGGSEDPILPLMCQEAGGLESGAVPSTHITAGSFAGGYPPENVRLNGGSWWQHYNETNPSRWINVDFQTRRLISGFKLQTADDQRKLKYFLIEYSIDCLDFKQMTQQGLPVRYPGIENARQTATIMLDHVILARCVSLIPYSASDDIAPAIRMEVLTCPERIDNMYLAAMPGVQMVASTWHESYRRASGQHHNFIHAGDAWWEFTSFQETFTFGFEDHRFVHGVTILGNRIGSATMETSADCDRFTSLTDADGQRPMLVRDEPLVFPVPLRIRCVRIIPDDRSWDGEFRVRLHGAAGHSIRSSICGIPSYRRSPRIFELPTDLSTTTPLKSGESPATVRLERCDSVTCSHTCAGVLVDARFVLTSARCVTKDDGLNRSYRWRAVAGQTTKDETGMHVQYVMVENVRLHPLYNYTLDNGRVRRVVNNVAVIQLAQSFKLHGRVSPLCLPDQDAPGPATGDLCYSAGFGQTTGQLHEIVLPIRSRDECGRRFENLNDIIRRNSSSTMEYFDQIRDENICAGSDDGSAFPCYTDEGAALVCPDEASGRLSLHGIFSWSQCISAGLQVSTRMTRYSDWVKEVMAETARGNR